MALTVSGKDFLRDAKKIIDIASQWDNSQAVNQSLLSEDEQTIRIRLSLSIADYVFQKVFLKLLRQYPKLSLKLDYCSTPTMFSYAEEATILDDIMIGGIVDQKTDILLQFAEKNQYDLELLVTPPSGVIVSAKHPLTKLPKVSLKELKKYDVAILNSSGEDEVMTLLSSYARQTVLITNNKNDILELVANQEVISWLSYFTVCDNPIVTQQKICFLPVEMLPVISYYIIYPSKNYISPTVKSVVKHIKDFFA